MAFSASAGRYATGISLRPAQRATRVSRPSTRRVARGVRAQSEKLDIERVSKIEDEISRQVGMLQC